MILRLAITLLAWQLKVDSSPARFKWVRGGRRAGKTKFIAYWLVKMALTLGAGKYWYVTKTLGLAREEFWPHLIAMIPNELIEKIDERWLMVKLKNGSIIMCKSGEKIDNLRGRGLKAVAIDEAAFLLSAVWDMILRPQLADYRGPALIFSSPKKGWFTQGWRSAASGADKNSAAFHVTIYDNPKIEREEIEQIKLKTPDHVWRQEYMAEEISQSGQVCEEFSPRSIYNPGEKFLDVQMWPTIAGIDYGHSDPTGVAWISAEPKTGYLVCSRQHKQANWDVPRHAQVIHHTSRRFQALGPGDFVLDASAFRKESTSMVSLADCFRKEGIFCQPADRDFNGTVDLLKRFLRGDGATPWLYVSSECPDIIAGLQDWEWGSHEPDSVAALRYGVEFAVRRRMTHLAHVFPKLKDPGDPLAELSAQEQLAFGRKQAARARNARWSFDLESGVPNY